MKTVSLKVETLRHIVDALSAAKASGLKIDTEQIVFDNSLSHGGGIVWLSKKAGILPKDKHNEAKPSYLYAIMSDR